MDRSEAAKARAERRAETVRRKRLEKIRESVAAGHNLRVSQYWKDGETRTWANGVELREGELSWLMFGTAEVGVEPSDAGLRLTPPPGTYFTQPEW